MTWYASRAVIFLLLAVAPVLAAEPEIRVLDGDTLKIGKVNYRLHGIDAPEKFQHCQKDNTDWLVARKPPPICGT